MIIFIWLFGAFFVGAVFGTVRAIGFWGSFLISFLLSPLIGLFITLFSEMKTKAEDRKKLLALQEKNNQLLQELNSKGHS